MNMRRRNFLSSAAALAITGMAGCSREKPAEPSAAANSPGDGKAGEIKTGGSRMIPIDGGKYRVWTKRVGRADIKVLTLHGGPGASHEYFECFEDFLPQNGIEFYYYDQLDSFNSDHPDDPKLWTMERFTDEVEQVRSALGLENFILYGQSWGGMLAIEYALKYPRHLRSVVISNMVASIPAYLKRVNEIRKSFPPETVRVMEKYEAKKQYEAPEYQKVIFEELYTKYLCRAVPWPEPVERTFRHLNQKIYNYMQGPNEFVVTGTFKDWDRTADLKNIKTRALLMSAKYDEMDADEIRRMAASMPNARAVISDKGSHLTMWDDQDWYFRELIRFLKES